MNWKLSAALLAAFYLLFLVLGLPAAHVVAALDVPPDRLSAASMQGTALSGRAAGVRVSRFPVGEVSWRLAPLALFTGCLEYRLALETGGAGKGRGRYGQCLGSRRYLEGATGLLGMNELAPVLGVAGRMLAPEGQIELELESVRQQGQAYADARGRLLWRAASVGQGQPVQLGDVAIDLSVEDERLTAAARNQGGDVDLNATISLDVAGGYEVQGRLKPRAGADVQQALATVGARQPDGSYALRLKGTL